MHSATLTVTNPAFPSVEAIPDLSGKTAIVTGGNTGIGYETCLALLNKNAKVYMASRSRQRATDAIERLEKATGKKCEFLELDLQDLKQVKGAAESFLKNGEKLDLLINNAGIMACPFALTKDGIETQFGTNHVGHFLFTTTLIPAILKADKPRIVNLSSSAQRMAPKNGIEFENINNEKAMSNFERYGQSKLANILFTRSLNKRYGDKIYVNAVHPGVVQTELLRGIEDSMGGKGSLLYYLSRPLVYVGSFFQLTAPQGAMATLYAATSPEIEKEGYKGRYVIPFGHVTDDTIPLAKDDSLAEKLWTFTENLIKEKLN
ncbi:hypothetical protein EDD86DRAFT_190325 [Gorgonomyces haynaldii]|nr:hypothetical protein EDD86DRAFT_190325 [Gorgonomyces haynaldii]